MPSAALPVQDTALPVLDFVMMGKHSSYLPPFQRDGTRQASERLKGWCRTRHSVTEPERKQVICLCGSSTANIRTHPPRGCSANGSTKLSQSRFSSAKVSYEPLARLSRGFCHIGRKTCLEGNMARLA